MKSLDISGNMLDNGQGTGVGVVPLQKNCEGKTKSALGEGYFL